MQITIKIPYTLRRISKLKFNTLPFSNALKTADIW